MEYKLDIHNILTIIGQRFGHQSGLDESSVLAEGPWGGGARRGATRTALGHRRRRGARGGEGGGGGEVPHPQNVILDK